MIILRMLATWRLAYMLVNEVGPGRVFETLRQVTGVDTSDPNMTIKSNDFTPLDCVYCTSLWLALLVAPILPSWLVYALALSAGVILIDDLKESLDAIESERESN